MAWYLNNATGADSRINIPSVVIGAAVGDYIEFKCVANADNVSNIYVLAGLVSGTTSVVRVEPTRIFLTAGNSSTSFTAGYVQPPVGDIFVLRLTKSSATTWTATLNGSTISANTLSNNLTLTAFGSRNSSATDAFRGGYYHVDISTNGGASATRYYDPNTSGGTGNLLIDRVSNQNGTQAGTWPTDNSEWIFYDDGGATTSAISASWPMFSASATQNQSIPSVDSAIAAAWPMLSVSAGQSQSIPGVTSSVSAQWPMFSASVTQSQAVGYASSVALTWPMFTASAVQSQSLSASSSAVAASWPMFATSALQGSNAPVYSVSISSTWPMFSTRVTFDGIQYYTDIKAELDILRQSRQLDVELLSRTQDIRALSRTLDITKGV